MAGRGTDIMLGGNAEFLAVAEMARRNLDPAENAEEYEAVWPDVLAEAEESVAAEHEEVTELGGLYVLGTERHESRRIDNQLRGRSGRQGDPGESQFYLSMRDDLMRLFNSGMAEALMARSGMADVPLTSKMVGRAIESAQNQVEARNFEIRKNVLKYDDVLSRQREVIYAERRKVLEGADLHEQIRHFIDDVVDGYVKAATEEGFGEDWDVKQLLSALASIYPVGLTASTPTTVERRRSVKRGCASWSGGWCCRCSTGNGVSISTRWTTCRRGSRCARWPSVTRSWSTSVRATSCSRR
jgi:preprotein translocase subunit SecA